MNMQVKRTHENLEEEVPDSKKIKTTDESSKSQEKEEEKEESAEATTTEEYEDEEDEEEEEENGEEEEDDEVEQVLLVVQERKSFYVDNFIHYVPLSEFASKMNKFIPEEKEKKLISDTRKARWLCDKILVNINECINREDVEGLDYEETLQKVWKELISLLKSKNKPWSCYRVIPSQRICIVAQAVVDLNGLVM